jgi:NTE family protein
LATAARVSCTYPFYMPPKSIEGHLLYDGGIFNNFPIDVIYSEFLPDVIIGCNVSGQIETPREDDVLSQLQAMITYRKDVDSPCGDTIVVRPVLKDVGTFDFDRVERAISAGYDATQSMKNAIAKAVVRRMKRSEIDAIRTKYRRSGALEIDQIEIAGLSKTQERYVHRVMGLDKGSRYMSDLKDPFFRVSGDEKIRSIYPIVKFDSLTGKRTLHLDARRNRSFQLEFGGNFSSRSINTGYLGFRYHLFGLTSGLFEANTYFGRFYGSVHSALRWDFPGRFPAAIRASFTYNRWDFYRSLTTFFDDVKPSFVLLNERFGSAQVSFPLGNHATFKAEAIYTHQFDQYYQSPNFISTDTADRTEFNAWMPRISLAYNTLNRKQFASKGTHFILSTKFVQGVEYSIPGTTSEVRDTIEKLHSWIAVRAKLKSFINDSGKLRVGYHLEGLWSDQDVFINYIGTVANTPAFQPTMESPTYFLPLFRSTHFAAGGLLLVGMISDDLELRGEGYIMNSFVKEDFNVNSSVRTDYRWRPLYSGSMALVYHSIIGPFSVGAYYHEKRDVPWSFLFNYGYILFNASPRD